MVPAVILVERLAIHRVLDRAVRGEEDNLVLDIYPSRLDRVLRLLRDIERVLIGHVVKGPLPALHVRNEYPAPLDEHDRIASPEVVVHAKPVVD